MSKGQASSSTHSSSAIVELTDSFALPRLPVSELFQHLPNVRPTSASVAVGMEGVVHGSSTQTRAGEITPDAIQLTSTSHLCVKQVCPET